MRTPINILVMGFDPNKDPSVAEMLKAERAKNPKVERIYCHSTWGMVETPKGVFCLDTEGVGPDKPIDNTGLPVEFYREYEADAEGKSPWEPMPFARATFSLEEVKALATGVHKRLDEFIETFGRRKEGNYQDWASFLSKELGLS